MLKRKILIVSLVYTMWLGVLLFSEIQYEINNSLIAEILLRPYMTAVVYPLVFNVLGFFVYSHKPLEKERDNVILTWVVVIASVCLTLRGIAKYMYAGLAYVGR